MSRGCIYADEMSNGFLLELGYCIPSLMRGLGKDCIDPAAKGPALVSPYEDLREAGLLELCCASFAQAGRLARMV